MRTTRSWNSYRNRTTSSTGTRFGRTSTTRSTGWSCSSPQFKPVRSECECRMGSYRNIYSQFAGMGTQTPISPATARQWIRLINTGARVYKFSPVQFSRYFGSQWSSATSTSCFRYMKQRFGSGIKAVARGKGNCWLVCATQTVTARPFSNYSWK